MLNAHASFRTSIETAQKPCFAIAPVGLKTAPVAAGLQNDGMQPKFLSKLRLVTHECACTLRQTHTHTEHYTGSCHTPNTAAHRLAVRTSSLAHTQAALHTHAELCTGSLAHTQAALHTLAELCTTMQNCAQATLHIHREHRAYTGSAPS